MYVPDAVVNLVLKPYIESGQAERDLADFLTALGMNPGPTDWG